MQESDSLKKMLENMTGIYNDGEKLDVAFADQPEIRPTGTVVVTTDVGDRYGVDEGANELRLLADTVSHETEHYRESDLVGKREFMAEHPDTPAIAGFINNALEDAYVDKNRTDRFRGLRQTAAFKSDIVMETRPSLTELDTKSEQMVEGFLQISIAGYAKDVDQCDDDVQQFLAFARTQIEDVRTETDYQTRTEMSHDVVERFKKACPDHEAAEGYIEGQRLPTDDVPNFSDAELERWKEESSEESSSDSNEDEESAGSAAASESAGAALDDDMDMDDFEVQEGSSVPSWLKYVGVLGAALFMGAGIFMALNGMWVPLAIMILIALILLWLLNKLFSGGGASASGEASGEGESAEGSPEPSDEASGEASGDSAEDSSESSAADEEASSEDPDYTEDEIEKALEEMTDQNNRGESRDWHDIDEDVDYDEVSDDMQERFERLGEMEAADWGELEDQRDELLDRVGKNEQKVEGAMARRGLQDDIEQAFRELKTRDRDVAATSGKRIHTRNAVRHRAGDMSEDKLYYHRQKAETGDRVVGVAVDLSGSMDSHETRIALASLAQATDIIGDQFLARGYTKSGHMASDVSNEGEIALPVITGVDEDFDMEHVNIVQANGKTPTGSGIRSTRGLLRRGSRPEKVLICITDGKPNVTSPYTSTSNATVEAKHEVRKTRREGMKAIGIGVGQSVDEATMDEVFDGNYIMVDEDNLADSLVEIYRGQMKVSE